MVHTTTLIDDTNLGNEIEIELSPTYLELTAEWAGDIYGEGQITLSTNQAKKLLVFLQNHLQDKVDFSQDSVECDVCGKGLGLMSVYSGDGVVLRKVAVTQKGSRASIFCGAKRVANSSSMPKIKVISAEASAELSFRMLNTLDARMKEEDFDAVEFKIVKEE